MDGIKRLEGMFEDTGGRAALIGFHTAGFPERETSLRICLALLEHCDALEVGIPFSDPVLDGPVIQESSFRALQAGFRPSDVFGLVKDLRKATQKPLLIMTYYNPVHRLGHGRFASAAAEAGADGILIPDLPPEEMGDWRETAEGQGLAVILFASMTTSDERLRMLGELTRGFLYCFAVKGITGPRESLSRDLGPFLERARRFCTKPIAAGLGVSNPEQCREVGRLADGVIVGSALVKAALEAVDAGRDPALAVSALAAGLRGALESD
ncbi:tryptophan synthase subunit alpha [Candidatus Solincola tengchongensis]|uniref:tryptophan synthase subunit alpha n=1 Tax=Candidatus Solincola tengchongensis TaxID=2900693 RepID=UPI00257CB188|nr:tryptophan synthase subunit alpha [Candidatus Solincola tengchongensis]